MKTVNEAIKTLSAQYSDRKARWKALKSVKWVLQTPAGQYAGLGEHARCILCVDQADPRIQTFDGRDNERQKAAYYSAVLGVQLQPVLVSHAT